METRDRFDFSGWEVHSSDASKDRFGVVAVGEAGRPTRSAAHLMDFLPRLHMRTDGAISGGGGQQLRIARF